MVKLDELRNTAAERDILGSILTAPEDLHKVSGIIKTDDFYRQDYRVIYETMARMILQGDSLDIVTLCEELRKTGQLEKVGGVRNVSDIASAGKCWNMQEKAGIVAEYSRRRMLVEKARALEADAADLEKETDTTAATFCNDLQGIGAKANKDTGDMEAAALELLATIDSRRKGVMLGTGLKDVDAIIGGFEPGQLITIAGRTGQGKSAMAATIAVNLAKRGKKILMFSMEMGKGEMAGRFVSRLAKLPGALLKKPECMTAEQQAALSKGLDEMRKLPIKINVQGKPTPADVGNEAARMKRTDGLDLIIIDYVQLMATGTKLDNSENRVQAISFITRELKGLARSLDVPIVILSQLSRASDQQKRSPRLSDLRDSGSIEQDSNTVMLIFEDTEVIKTPGKTVVDVAKQRNGEVRACNVYFVKSRGFFANYDSSRDVPL